MPFMADMDDMVDSHSSDVLCYFVLSMSNWLALIQGVSLQGQA